MRFVKIKAITSEPAAFVQWLTNVVQRSLTFGPRWVVGVPTSRVYWVNSMPLCFKYKEFSFVKEIHIGNRAESTVTELILNNVDSTSWRWINVDSRLTECCVPAEFLEFSLSPKCRNACYTLPMFDKSSSFFLQSKSCLQIHGILEHLGLITSSYG